MLLFSGGGGGAIEAGAVVLPLPLGVAGDAPPPDNSSEEEDAYRCKQTQIGVDRYT